MALQLRDTLNEAITACTGLSAATFFTVLAFLWTIYYVVTSLFGSSDAPPRRSRDFEEMELVPPPVQLGEVTEEELKQYDGSDPKKPLLMAIKGQIYDVSQSRMLYGPGGPCALFAGKDASRALAKMSFEEKDLIGDISGLGSFYLEALQDWESEFMSKYVKVGTIKKTVQVIDGDASGEAVEAKENEPAKPAENGPSESAAAGSEEMSKPKAGEKERTTARYPSQKHENSTPYVDGIGVSYATNNSDAEEEEGTMEKYEDNGPGSCEEDGQENNDELRRRGEEFIAKVHGGWRAEHSRKVR
ncbi:hypothetical protein SLEP1_g3491 [Rubroshorea leprosula]|uniref:Cytochrome b5 heme-binding domain-containing protein n=1 Tax=Rubroshorea leprosula TaxID=152421 RepID=A0AAV5HUD5_9ROSI|nr:hypothetical protein SLEP1_g3491 [Rubroshorea leprosula]